MSEVRTVKMTLDMAKALNDLLLSLTPKGRAEMREHKHLMVALRESCMWDFTYQNQQTKKDDIQSLYNAAGGDLKISRDSAIEYILDPLSKKIEAGISGAMSVGYNDLAEAFDGLKEELKKCSA